MNFNAPWEATQQSKIGPVWLTCALVVILDTALYVSGNGDLLRIAIPVGAAFVGLALYSSWPVGYTTFTLWTWFLTPLVRRLIDYRMGFANPNLVLLTPFLVSAIAGLSLLRKSRAASFSFAPSYLCVAAILCGFAVGIIRSMMGAPDAVSPAEVMYGLIDWLAPLLFGLFLYKNWESYPEHSQAIQRAFVWATILLGAYGVYQYFAPPPWDTFWLESLPGGLDTSTFGRPEALQIRVWSTLNAPGPFADFMVAGLLFTFLSCSRIKVPALIAGFCSFGLSLVRTSWVLMPISFAFAMRSARRPRHLFLFALPVPALAIVVALAFPHSESVRSINERVTTMTNLHSDESAQDRLRMYEEMAGELATMPAGIGLSNQIRYHAFPIDSGFINMWLQFGIVGTIVYLGGVVSILFPVLRSKSSPDLFLAASKGILFASLFQLVGSEVFVGLQGIIVWISIAGCAAGISYENSQRVLHLTVVGLDAAPADSMLPAP